MRLERQKVVEEALRLLNEVGIEGLTTRRLAQALGVQGPALYWHFKNKQELLDDMARAILKDAYGPLTPGRDWADWMAEGARRVRRQLLSYRDGARILAGFRPSSPLGRFDQAPWFEILAQAGFKETDALWAMLTVALFTLGWTMDEQAAQDRNTPPTPLARLSDQGFEFGLNTVMMGLRARLDGLAPEVTVRAPELG